MILNLDTKVKAIIFDLGGVLIDLSIQRSIDAFATLAQLSPEAVSLAFQQQPEFIAFECGELTDTEFRAALRKLFSITATDNDLDACWNAMLLDIPNERIRLLESLREHYQLFLLSNTNRIHQQHFNQIVNRNSIHSCLDHFFDKAYYSHAIKMRKPNKKIYDYVLGENNLHAHETLFLDDSLINLEAAQQLGIHTYHVQHPDQILSLFNLQQV